MTALDLDAIKARAEAATPAPWQRANNVVDMGPPSDSPFAVCHSDADPSPSPQNAEFIAHARKDVPALIAEVERLRARRGYASIRLEKARQAAEDLLRKEQQHSGTGREGHLSEDDLLPLFEALGAVYLDDPDVQLFVVDE